MAIKTNVAGSKGGKATLKKYGKEHYAKLAKRMHAKRRKAEKAGKK